eukprot:1336874-Amorphochlora_amoeboformis.AAC.2
MATAKELQHFLEVLPYGEENNSFGLVGWQWCTTTDDPNVGQVSDRIGIGIGRVEGGRTGCNIV